MGRKIFCQPISAGVRIHILVKNHTNCRYFFLVDGYRCFAAEHAELYKIIMQMPSGDDAVLKEAAAMTAEPFMRVLADYRLTEKQKMHWQRVLRGLMHGFVSEAQAGYFSHYSVPVEESYEIAVCCMIDGLHKEEGESNGR